MKVVLTNLSNELYSESRFRLNQSAIKHGIDDIYSFDFSDIKETEFFDQNKEILESPKGLGYWLWKPYLVLQAFNKIVDGDIVIYSDCGIEIIDSLDPLFQIAEDKSIVLFGNANDLNFSWTKRDCFVFMDCDSEYYWYSLHIDAAFSLFKKCEYSINFLNDWLRYGKNANNITDLPNICGKENINGFLEHRWDQSILSLLAHKYKLELFRMPTQFGNHYKTIKYRIDGEFNCVNQMDQSIVSFYSGIPYYNSFYFQLLNHHRSKKITEEVNIEEVTVKKNVNPINVIQMAKIPFRLVLKLTNVILKFGGFKVIRL